MNAKQRERATDRILKQLWKEENEFASFADYRDEVLAAKWSVIPIFSKNWVDCLTNCREQGILYPESVLYGAYVLLCNGF